MHPQAHLMWPMLWQILLGHANQMLLVTCGDFLCDALIPRQCERVPMPVPHYMNRLLDPHASVGVGPLQEATLSCFLFVCSGGCSSCAVSPVMLHLGNLTRWVNIKHAFEALHPTKAGPISQMCHQIGIQVDGSSHHGRAISCAAIPGCWHALVTSSRCHPHVRSAASSLPTVVLTEPWLDAAINAC